MINKSKYFSILGFPLISTYLLVVYLLMEMTISLEDWNNVHSFTKYMIITIIIINHIDIFRVEIINSIEWISNLIINTIISIFYLILKLLTMAWENKSLTGMIVFSIVWISIIVFLITSYHSGHDLLKYLNTDNFSKGLKLNEWGDFFAGFMAPLALGWLAYSIYYQKKEFENVHGSLKEQVLELEMEKSYTSYEQQINKIDSLIDNINAQMNTLSLREVNEKFTLSNPTDYLKVATNTKKIFLLNENIEKLLKRHNSKQKSVDSLKVLEEQYKIIYAEDIEIIYKILLKYCFLITISDKEIKHLKPYESFNILDNWLTQEKKDKILEIIENIEGESLFSKKIDPAFIEFNKNFKDYLFLLNHKEIE
ncbi:hypothetical protein [Sulfurimonas sp.]|uniref:hypothetical protein n=1 Tax=Sulfurimonas sp. TaxID=2022749 RepID=UPI0035666F0A